MSKVNINISGFWIFLIGICVILPAIKHITGTNEEESPNGEVTIKVPSGKNSILTVVDNSTRAPINTKVKIPMKEGTVIVKKVSPDKGEPEVIMLKGKYTITSFDQKGSWEINMYDINELLVDWIKVTVY